jgi:hypothetical protein
VLIVTYGCAVATSAPPVVSHEHKESGLFAPDQIAALRMPDGYRTSIMRWCAQQ